MILSLASLNPITHAQSSIPSLRLIPSVTITDIDSPNTPIKQGESFTTIVMIENTYSTSQDIEIRFDLENTGITKPDPNFITLTSGSNERKYNFETSQNVIPGNYVVNIQLWSNPNPDSFILAVSPELLDTSNFEIIIEEPIQAPQSPLNLNAKTISSSEIQLRWQKPQDNVGSDIIGYKIERKIDSNLFSTLVENTGTIKTSYQDTDLKPDTEYSYRVFAINSVGISEPSNEDSATTSKEPVPRISLLNTDKSNYQTDGQNNIVVTVTGHIENPYKESTTVDVTLEKSNNSNISSTPQRSPVDTNGNFQAQFYLDPKKFTTGSYDVEAMYEDLSKTIHFGIKSKQPNFPPVITMPQDIIQTATDPKGAYISFDVTITDEEDNTNSLNLDCNKKQGWFNIDNHQINCTVTDSGGKSDNGSFKITVNNALPISEIFVLSSDDSFEIDRQIDFSAEDSYDPDGGTITQYIWNFRDGNPPIITTSPEISHSYKKEGTFDVSLDVIDDENSRSNQSGTVKISVSANYIWIIVVTLVCAIGGVGVIAAKYLLKPKSKISPHQDLSTNNKPENDNDSKKQSSIDMDIEFGSGIEKK